MLCCSVQVRAELSKGSDLGSAVMNTLRNDGNHAQFLFRLGIVLVLAPVCYYYVLPVSYPIFLLLPCLSYPKTPQKPGLTVLRQLQLQGASHLPVGRAQ